MNLSKPKGPLGSGWLKGIAAISHYCRISRNHFFTLKQKWDFPIVKIGRTWYSTPEALDEWLVYLHKKNWKKILDK